MWQLGTWVGDGLSSAGGTVWLCCLRVKKEKPQRAFPTQMVQWSCSLIHHVMLSMWSHVHMSRWNVFPDISTSPSWTGVMSGWLCPGGCWEVRAWLLLGQLDERITVGPFQLKYSSSLSFPSFPFPSRMWITAPWSQHSVPAVNHQLFIGKMETWVEAINSLTLFSVSDDDPQAQFTSALWFLMDFCGVVLHSSCDWFLKSWKISVLFRKFQPCQYHSSSGSEQIDQISS